MVRRRLSLGFVGGGWNSAVGATHFTAACMDGLFKVDAGVFSRHADINRQTGERWNVPGDRVYDTVEQLLQKEAGRLDAVVVLTPTPDHAETVLRTLEAGFAVICEKALAASATDARQIAEVVEKTDGFVAVTFNYTGYPMVRELRQMIAQGHLGRITHIHAEMPQEGFVRLNANREPATPQKWRTADGAIPTIALDLGDHLYHLVRFLTGERPLEMISVESTHGAVDGVIDNVMCLAKYTGDIDCSYWFGKSALGHRNGLRLRIYGREGAAEWRQATPEDLHFTDVHGQTTVLDRGSVTVSLANQPRYTRFKAGHPAGFIEAFANLYDDIGAALTARRDGLPFTSDYVFDATDSVDGLVALETMTASAKMRRWTKVPAKDQDRSEPVL